MTTLDASLSNKFILGVWLVLDTSLYYECGFVLDSELRLNGHYPLRSESFDYFDATH